MKASDLTTRPALWERLLAVVTWLSVNITLLAVVIGLTEFLLCRKRRPFLAKHGLWAMIMQGLLVLYQLWLMLFSPFHKVSAEYRSTLVFETFPTMLRTPKLIPVLWNALTAESRLLLALLFVGVGTAVLVSLIGSIVALIRHWTVQRSSENKQASPEAISL